MDAGNIGFNSSLFLAFERNQVFFVLGLSVAVEGLPHRQVFISL
jgi:hypothetical protein